MRWLAILVVAALGFLAAWFIKPTGTKIVETVKTVTIPGDSIPYPVPTPVPVPYDSISYKDSLVYQKVDTASILRRYFTQYFYQDTIRDSTFLAILREVVTENRIVDRKLDVQNLRPQAITYATTVINPEPRLFLGPAVSYNGTIGFGGSVMYINNNNAYQVTGDVSNRIITATWLHSIKWQR